MPIFGDPPRPSTPQFKKGPFTSQSHHSHPSSSFASSTQTSYQSLDRPFVHSPSPSRSPRYRARRAIMSAFPPQHHNRNAIWPQNADLTSPSSPQLDSPFLDAHIADDEDPSSLFLSPLHEDDEADVFVGSFHQDKRQSALKAHRSVRSDLFRARLEEKWESITAKRLLAQNRNPTLLPSLPEFTFPPRSPTARCSFEDSDSLPDLLSEDCSVQSDDSDVPASPESDGENSIYFSSPIRRKPYSTSLTPVIGPPRSLSISSGSNTTPPSSSSSLSPPSLSPVSPPPEPISEPIDGWEADRQMLSRGRSRSRSFGAVGHRSSASRTSNLMSGPAGVQQARRRHSWSQPRLWTVFEEDDNVETGLEATVAARSSGSATAHALPISHSSALRINSNSNSNDERRRSNGKRCRGKSVHWDERVQVVEFRY